MPRLARDPRIDALIWGYATFQGDSRARRAFRELIFDVLHARTLAYVESAP